MKKLILCFALILLSVSANARQVECVDSMDSSFKISASFDSTQPIFIGQVTLYKADGSVDRESKTPYLTTNFACENNINFSTDCTSQEKHGRLGYSYKFSCKAKNISGEFYVDENGNGTFSCSNQPGASQFFGCTVK